MLSTRVIVLLIRMLIIDGVKYKLWTPKDEEKEFSACIESVKMRGITVSKSACLESLLVSRITLSFPAPVNA